MLFLFVYMPVIILLILGIYSLVQYKKEDEKEYQEKLKYVKENRSHSYCSPEILRTMLESLNYKIYYYSPDVFHQHPDIVFLWCEQKYPSPSVVLYGNTRKEMEELVKIYNEYKKTRENIQSERLQKCHDHSYDFLSQVQKDLNAVIEQEYARQAAEMNKIKEIAGRLNEKKE